MKDKSKTALDVFAAISPEQQAKIQTALDAMEQE